VPVGAAPGGGNQSNRRRGSSRRSSRTEEESAVAARAAITPCVTVSLITFMKALIKDQIIDESRF
jgi:hypothetical protein